MHREKLKTYVNEARSTYIERKQKKATREYCKV